MDFLKTLNGCFNSSVPSFRKVVLNDSFNDYYKTLLELEQKEREIVKLDEQIFGSVYPLKVGFLALNTYHTKNYGEFVIYPSQETIVINEYLRPLYGNGCINREEQIKTHEYSTIKTCFSNEMIIIALRRLKKFFDDEFASKKDKIDFLEYRKFANASLHDKLFYAILQNYDFISYFFCLDNITELDIASEYDLFMKTSPIYSKIAIMPTKSKFYQDLAKYSDRFNKHNAKKPSFESAEFAISTVLSEFEKANQSLNQHKEYKLMKMDYEDLKKIVLQKENQLTYVN